MIDLLLPRTDAGVLVQAVVVFPILGAWLAWVRRDPDWRLLALGVLVMTIAWFGLRAVH
ncbi:MAG: hypothetical protein ACRDZ1_04730 [Acidimicrobiia bacterium]